MDTLEKVRAILRDTLQLGSRADALRRDSRLLGEIPEFDSMAVVSVLTAAVVATLVMAAPAPAAPVATNDAQYSILGRVFPDPLAGCTPCAWG